MFPHNDSQQGNNKGSYKNGGKMKMKMKKKLTNKHVESILLIGVNEELKKLIHENMATVHKINRKKKKNIKVQINIEIKN